MKLLKFKQIICLFLILDCSTVFAAKPVNLDQENPAFLRNFLSMPTTYAHKRIPNDLQETARTVDHQEKVHVRLQQTYHGYKVWGGNAIIHIPHGANVNKYLPGLVADAEKSQGTMSGKLYQNLADDLSTHESAIFSEEQREKAQAYAIQDYEQKKNISIQPSKKHSELIVYVDANNQAHFAFFINFYFKQNGMPVMPHYLLDASTFKIYEQWNEVQSLETVDGGGFGGNKKMGKLVYDGLPSHLAKLTISRDPAKQLCFLKNSDVEVIDFREGKHAQFTCVKKNSEHNDIYWDGEHHQVNEGYSPDNDVLYAGKIIHSLYRDWLQQSVLTRNAKAMPLIMVTHAPTYDDEGNPNQDNAHWDPEEEKMYFGDGANAFYPLTSVDVAAHEISHGYTGQHAKLYYFNESGGMNESFSDMAAQAAEFYSYGHNSWMIGRDVTRNQEALRYFAEPTKDCNGRRPGNQCSIDHIRDYQPGMNVHFSSGIYNRMFYLLANSPGWDIKKAFTLMAQAQNYWTPNSSFTDGACGVLSAAKDLSYAQGAIVRAFNEVGILTNQCR